MTNDRGSCRYHDASKGRLIRQLTSLGLSLLAMVAFAMSVSADPIAKVKRIEDLSGAKTREIESASDRVTVTRASGNTIPAFRDTVINTEDILTVRGAIATRLQGVSRSYKSDIVVTRTPQSVDSLGAVRWHLLSPTAPRPLYEVLQGTATVKYDNGGGFFIKVFERIIESINTEVLVSVLNPDSAIVYLRHGKLLISGEADSVITAGEIVIITPLGVSMAIVPDKTIGERYEGQFEHYANEIWEGPWYKNPWTYVIGGGIGVAAYYLITCPWCDAEGSVEVRFP